MTVDGPAPTDDRRQQTDDRRQWNPIVIVVNTNRNEASYEARRAYARTTIQSSLHYTNQCGVFATSHRDRLGHVDDIPCGSHPQQLRHQTRVHDVTTAFGSDLTEDRHTE